MSTTKTQIDADELTQTAADLAPLPQSTSEIMAILADPMFEVSELIKVTSLDPTLAASLLRLANSAFYSRGKPVNSIGDAVVRLGSGTILALAIMVSARPPVDVNLMAFGLDLKQYWQHSVATVAAAEEMASRRIANFRSGLSPAALLHDFGKLILAAHVTPERLKCLTEFQATHPCQRRIDAERAILGVDHAVAGGVVARRWNLPEEIVVAIECHHDPVDWEQDLTNGVIVANNIAKGHEEATTGFAFAAAEILADAMLALGVTDEVYHEIVEASRSRYEVLIESFSKTA